MEPTQSVPFRGMLLEGEHRSWQDIPYPEKIGLADTVLQEEHDNPVEAMARYLELGRLTQVTRNELQKLLETANELSL